MKRMITAVLALAGIGLLLEANADVIADYTFATSDASANSSILNVTAGSFLPVGLGLTGLAGRSSSAGGNMFARASGTHSANQLNIGNAISDGDYLSVTIGADAGYQMNLTSLTLDYGYTRNGSFDGKQFKVYLLTDIDGFVDAGDIVDSETINIGPNTSSPVYTATTLDLSGAQFQGITTTEFRLYLADDTGSADYIHRIDNVVLNGTVTAIPEPATISMLGLGAVLSFFFRRRRNV